MLQKKKPYIIVKQQNQDSLMLNSYELVGDVEESLCSVNSHDSFREYFDKQYGKMDDQEFFECKQNLFGFFALLDDIAQEQEIKKVKENAEIEGSNVHN